MVRETSRLFDAASDWCRTPSRVPHRRAVALSADIALQAPAHTQSAALSIFTPLALPAQRDATRYIASASLRRADGVLVASCMNSEVCRLNNCDCTSKYQYHA